MRTFTGSRPQLLIPAHLWLNGEDEDDGEGDSSPNVDPCYRYKILDQAWRATNYTTKGVKCDRQVKWQGWYRLYYRGRSIQMPEKCIKANHCGTHAPLWLTQAHPKIRHTAPGHTVPRHTTPHHTTPNLICPVAWKPSVGV